MTAPSASGHKPLIVLREIPPDLAAELAPPGSAGAQSLSRKPAIVWPDMETLNHGGGAIAGVASDTQIQALWADDARFLEAWRLSPHDARRRWEEDPRQWADGARRAGPRASLSVFVPGDLLGSRHASARKATPEELADLLWAPAGSRSAKILIGLRDANGTQWPSACFSLLGFAQETFDAAQRKALMDAFRSGALDAAAAMAANQPDASADAKGAAPQSQEAALDGLAFRAQKWVEASLTASQRRGGAPSALTRWAEFMAQAWALQEPEAARAGIEAALAAAAQNWRWENLPKKSAPGEMTRPELLFCVLARRAQTVARAAGASLPERIALALDTIAARESNIPGAKKGAKKGKSASASQARASAASGSQSSAASGPAASPSAAAPVAEEWSPEKLQGRQNVLLTALDSLDDEALAWCLGAGGLQGDRLLFARGNTRGGPVDSLCVRANWGDKQPWAAQALERLAQAGLDFTRECKAPGGRKLSNPFIRGAALASNNGRASAGPLMSALAFCQVRSCLGSGMDLSDVEAWRAEALVSKEVERIAKYGGGEVDPYFSAVRAAIEQFEIQQAMDRKAGAPGANEACRDANALGAQTEEGRPAAKRRAGRL